MASGALGTGIWRPARSGLDGSLGCENPVHSIGHRNFVRSGRLFDSGRIDQPALGGEYGFYVMKSEW